LADGGLTSGPAVLPFPPAADEWGVVVRVLGPIIIIAPVIVDFETFGTAVVSSVPIAVVSTTLLAANLARRNAVFHNDSVNRFLFLKWGSPASTVSYTVRIGPQGHYELPLPIYNGIVTGIWNAAGAGACLITELSPP
jgi:hypothetical protein